MPADPALLKELKELRAKAAQIEAKIAINSLSESTLELLPASVWKEFFAGAPGYAIIVDTHGRAVYCNRYAPGVTEEDFLGTKMTDWLSPDSGRRMQEAIDRVLREGTEIRLEVEDVRFGLTWLNRLGPIRHGGKIIAVGVLTEDITEQLRIKQQLVASEERWRAVAEGVPDAVLILSLDGRVEYINRVSPEYRIEEVVGTDGVGLLSEECRVPVFEAVRKVAETGESVEVEFQDARRRTWFLAHLGPLQIGGKRAGIIAVCRDITQRRLREELLRENEQRLRFLVDNMPVVAWTVDRELRFTSTSGAALSGLDQTPNSGVGQSLFEYFHVTDDAFEPIARHRQALAGESVTYEMRWAGRTYFTHVDPMRDGTGAIVGAIGVAVDITARSEMEQSILSSREDLERQIAQRTAELQTANQSLNKEFVVLKRLVDIHERDRQLIAYDIHDGLVQDMAGAGMFFESAAEVVLAKGGHAAESYTRGLQLLREIVQEARRLINGLKPPVLEKFGLLDALDTQIDEMRMKSDIQIDFKRPTDVPRLAPTVENAVYRIVVEALNNVLMHSKSPRAKVELAADGVNIRIKVRDWGIGFNPEKVKQKRFGLISIRERARLLGGEAEILSVIGKGTKIRAVLPVADILLPADYKRDLDFASDTDDSSSWRRTGSEEKMRRANDE